MNNGNILYALKARATNGLKSLSFRTGVIILASCIPFYIMSFAQMMLPISTTAKGILWATLFGLAKGVQYLGIFILGAEGVRRIKRYVKQRRNNRRRKESE